MEAAVDGTEAVAAGPSDPEALSLLGMAAFAVGDQLRAADLLARAEAGCRREARLGLLTQVLALRSAVGMDLGTWDDAATAVDEARRLASETRQSTWRAGTVSTTARGHALRGQVGPARELAAELEPYVERRLTQARAGQLQVTVGHTDLLVLP